MTSKMNVQTSEGGTHTDVDERGLERLVEGLGSGTEFLIVEVDGRDGAYAQATPTPPQVKRSEAFTVEFRDGPHQHWQGFTNERSEVQAVLAGWATGADDWKDRIEWTKLDLGF